MKALKITQTAGENVKEIAPCTCKVIQDSLEFWISVWIPIPQYWIPMSFLAFLVSGAWIPYFRIDSSPLELLGFRIAPNKNIPCVPESGFPYLEKREKESLILPVISAGPRNHPTTGLAHADVPAIVSEGPVI